MIGAGIFALVGQVAEFAGDFFPIAFLLGAIVAAISSYSCVRYSSVSPLSGGIAMLLKDAYGPGVAAGSFSLFMFVFMVVAESLLARMFGTYLLRPFGLQDSVVLVPVLGVAAIVNFVGNTVVERSATTTAIVKILGIAVLAIAGLSCDRRGRHPFRLARQPVLRVTALPDAAENAAGAVAPEVGPPSADDHHRGPCNPCHRIPRSQPDRINGALSATFGRRSRPTSGSRS